MCSTGLRRDELCRSWVRGSSVTVPFAVKRGTTGSKYHLLCNDVRAFLDKDSYQRRSSGPATRPRSNQSSHAARDQHHHAATRTTPSLAD